jgi:crotonobetainyl-CoA:carnitine CoA-transferase CaiB-like acyl-CoA transferase
VKQFCAAIEREDLTDPRFSNADRLANRAALKAALKRPRAQSLGADRSTGGIGVRGVRTIVEAIADPCAPRAR